MSGDDRDKLTLKTPPPEIAEQIARPAHRADSQFGAEELTPVFGDPVTQINKRAKDAAGAARGAFAAIREVRAETKEGLRDLNLRAEKLSDKIGVVQGEVSGVKLEVAELKGDIREVSGKMTLLIDAHKERDKAQTDMLLIRTKADTDLETHERKTELEIFAAREKTDLEITAAREKTELEEYKDARKHRRAKVMWALGIIGAIITAFLAGKFGLLS